MSNRAAGCQIIIDGGLHLAIIPLLSNGAECPVRHVSFWVRVMYAVVKTGGKQYRVVENDVITVEKLVGEAGQAVELAEVLMLAGDQGIVLGDALKTAKVSAEIVRQARGPKIIIFKKRRRQNSRRKNGHRQDLTILKITGIHAA